MINFTEHFRQEDSWCNYSSENFDSGPKTEAEKIYTCVLQAVRNVTDLICCAISGDETWESLVQLKGQESWVAVRTSLVSSLKNGRQSQVVLV
jgi:hypothetical protein